MDTPHVIIIGGGISGIATLKTLHTDLGISATLLEASDDVGGLWKFTKDGYGVMDFTHINVSKYNYSFSDHPFPKASPDYPHHSQMLAYVESYVSRFDLRRFIQVNTEVINTFKEGGQWAVSVRDKSTGTTSTLKCSHLIVATGHHATPKKPIFPGASSFQGVQMHSTSYKDVFINGLQDKKKVLVVGIGNSAVDVAANLASKGRSIEKVLVSTRSGAWIYPNYIFGFATDLYASRLLLKVPWQITQYVSQTILKIINGHPNRWNLNPKMGVLQTQPTVSPTLIHHIQRGNIEIRPNIKTLTAQSVEFADGSVEDGVEAIIYCTGYSINLPFLPPNVLDAVLDPTTNAFKLYKNVFTMEHGTSLSFIGFVQPASGGVITMSEVQAQWVGQLIKGNVSLPSSEQMKAAIYRETDSDSKRYYRSSRHTIQKDPILYNDDIVSTFSETVSMWKSSPLVALRLLLGSGGSSQWRLQGPYATQEAASIVKAVPVPPFNILSAAAILTLPLMLVLPVSFTVVLLAVVYLLLTYLLG